MCALMYVGCPSDHENGVEPYHAVGNDEKEFQYGLIDNRLRR